MKNEVNQEVIELSNEINLFLTKSMATSVSHVDHQSSFFVYLKECLRIKENVESVTGGSVLLLTAMILSVSSRRRKISVR